MDKLRKNIVSVSLMGLLILGGAACNGDGGGDVEEPAGGEAPLTGGGGDAPIDAPTP